MIIRYLINTIIVLILCGIAFVLGHYLYFEVGFKEFLEPIFDHFMSM